MSAADSRKYIADRVRRHDYDRYFATLFCPADRRAALLSLYAFNLEIATIAESTREPLIGGMRLQWWRDAIPAILEGHPPGHPVAVALAEAAAGHDAMRTPFDRMIDGRELDLDDEAPKDLAALESYAEATSSSLVRLALAMLGASDAAAETIAHHAGLAWGLTGLLRAAPFHAAQGRAHLLEAIMAEPVADAARRHLDAVRPMLPALPRRALAAILPVAFVEPYLARLARARHDPFAGGVELPRHTRQWRMTVAALRGRV
jgi:phytoene synthase